MAMEVVCGNCQGRLLVEQTGVVVACPHCGAHLQIGDPTPLVSATTSTAPPPDFPSPTPAPPELSAPSFSPQFTPPVAPEPVAFVQPSPFEIHAPAPFAPESTSASEILPEIILTPPPPTPRKTPDTAEHPRSINENTELFIPTSPPAVSASDSDTWMPKIDLALPPDVSTTDPLTAMSETSTLILPPLSTSPPSDLPPSDLPPSDLPQSTPALTPPATDGEAAAPATTPTPTHTEKTGIWSRSKFEDSAFDSPTVMIPAGSNPSASNFDPFSHAGAASHADASATSTAPTFNLSDASTEILPVPATAQSHGSTIPIITTPEAQREAVVPRYLFVIVASYASAITLAFLYLWWRGAGGSTLDLPDVVPEFKNNKFGLTLIKEDPLPAAYRLKLGETKRYGNIEITPLKVTKGPLEFTYFNNSGTTKSPTSSPVLKLWVKFENVSDDQTFPPLDEKLLFPRVPDKQNVMQDRSNNYVCQQSERKRTGKRIPVYSVLINGDWLLKDQNLNTPLGPHKAWETYIPSNDEDLSSLQGPLTWRLHFRKGYNPTSFRGVTTLVEVEFDSKDIQG